MCWTRHRNPQRPQGIEARRPSDLSTPQRSARFDTRVPFEGRELVALDHQSAVLGLDSTTYRDLPLLFVGVVVVQPIGA